MHARSSTPRAKQNKNPSELFPAPDTEATRRALEALDSLFDTPDGHPLLMAKADEALAAWAKQKLRRTSVVDEGLEQFTLLVILRANLEPKRPLDEILLTTPIPLRRNPEGSRLFISPRKFRLAKAKQLQEAEASAARRRPRLRGLRGEIKPSMVGWKAAADRLSSITRQGISAEGMKKVFTRQGDARRAMNTLMRKLNREFVMPSTLPVASAPARPGRRSRRR